MPEQPNHPFDSSTRLYEFNLLDTQSQTEAFTQNLLVEAFIAQEGLQGIGFRDVFILSTDAHIDLQSLLSQSACLQVSLSDGTRTRYSGIINQAESVGSDGGFTRYGLRLVPWLWRLTQHHTSRVWQDQSVITIIESVFASYSEHAAWTWSDEVAAFMSNARPRSYCVQYRETDYAFISRLLTEEGLTWRIEEDDKAPAQHRLVLFADSTNPSAIPEDVISRSPLGGPGIRYQGAHAREQQDSIQALAAKRQLNAALTTVLSMDYKTKKSVSTTVPTHHRFGGPNAPRLESYDSPGLYAYANAAEAERYARLQQEAHEARNKLWLARSTVRTLRPGTRFTLSQSPLAQEDNPTDTEFLVLQVTSLGINNLPKPAQAQSQNQNQSAALLGSVSELLQTRLNSIDNAHGLTFNTELKLVGLAQQGPQAQQSNPLATLINQAEKTGYANQFTALRTDIPWRPVQDNETEHHNQATTSTNPHFTSLINRHHQPNPRTLTGNGLRQNVKPTAYGSQTAIVVGANGETRASGSQEIYCDRLGRVRIKFHWQGQHHDQNATCWVRVAQRSAGGGMGSQFLPRIGQEVQVQFIEGDIDRPIIIGALYNGQGEGGIVPTPGGLTEQTAHLTVFQPAHDHQSSAQGNLAGGNSPVWHGASGDSLGHRNSAAQWGIRTKEFGGKGYNQLLIDDTDQQGRIQLKTTQAASELNLGHLIHSADNYRGSFRGLGAELRTDAYGALRAGQGILISSYTIRHKMSQRDPAGDNAPGMAHIKQATQIVANLNAAAKVHQTVQLSGHIGSNKAHASAIANSNTHSLASSGENTGYDGNSDQAPLKAQLTAVSGMVNQNQLTQAKTDANHKNTRPEPNKLPHSTDPVIAIAAKGGLTVTAGQDLQLNNGENVHVITGQDSQFNTGHEFRLHTGQAIGMLAGATSPGQNNIGLQLIAAQDPINIQAQSDELKVQARDDVNIKSSHAHIDWAAAKSISLSTAGGANITLENGNITVQCPGKITVHAGQKSFLGPERINQDMPAFPKGSLVVPLMLQFDHAPAGIGTSWAGMPYKLFADGALIKQDVLDSSGSVPVMHSPAVQKYKLEMANGVQYDMPIADSYTNPEQGMPANKGFLKHQSGVPATDTGDTRMPETLRRAYHKVFKS